jgi:hypothetical protein
MKYLNNKKMKNKKNNKNDKKDKNFFITIALFYMVLCTLNLGH